MTERIPILLLKYVGVSAATFFWVVILSFGLNSICGARKIPLAQAFWIALTISLMIDIRLGFFG